MLRPFERELPRHRQHPALSRRVRDLPAEARHHHGGDRCEVDNAAALRLLEVRPRGLTGDENAVNLTHQSATKLLQRQFFHPPQFRSRQRHSQGHRYVRIRCQSRSSTRRPDPVRAYRWGDDPDRRLARYCFFCGGVGTGRVDVSADNGRALLGKAQRSFPTDAICHAGHDGDLVCQTFSHDCSLSEQCLAPQSCCPKGKVAPFSIISHAANQETRQHSRMVHASPQGSTILSMFAATFSMVRSRSRNPSVEERNCLETWPPPVSSNSPFNAQSRCASMPPLLTPVRACCRPSTFATGVHYVRLAVLRAIISEEALHHPRQRRNAQGIHLDTMLATFQRKDAAEPVIPAFADA